MKTIVIPSQQEEQVESQQSPEIYCAGRTSLGYALTIESFKNATRSTNFVSDKRSTLRYAMVTRSPTIRIKDAINTDRSGTLKIRLLQTQR